MASSVAAAEAYCAFATQNELDVAAAEHELLELKLLQRRAAVARLGSRV